MACLSLEVWLQSVHPNLEFPGSMSERGKILLTTKLYFQSCISTTFVISAFMEVPGILRGTKFVTLRTAIAAGVDMLCLNVLPQSRFVTGCP